MDLRPGQQLRMMRNVFGFLKGKFSAQNMKKEAGECYIIMKQISYLVSLMW
jgi:hypothetical protein